MSDFFDFIGDYTPMIVWLFLWACAAPIRVLLLLILPRNAFKGYNFANTAYEFLAFERRWS